MAITLWEKWDAERFSREKGMSDTIVDYFINKRNDEVSKDENLMKNPNVQVWACLPNALNTIFGFIVGGSITANTKNTATKEFEPMISNTLDGSYKFVLGEFGVEGIYLDDKKLETTDQFDLEAINEGLQYVLMKKYPILYAERFLAHLQENCKTDSELDKAENKVYNLFRKTLGMEPTKETNLDVDHMIDLLRERG